MQNNNGNRRIPPDDATDIPLAEMDPKVSDDVRKCLFTSNQN